MPTVRPYGDAALLVEFEARIDPTINERVHQLAGLVADERRRGSSWAAPIPAYASLLVPYDPLRMSFEQAAAAMGEIVGQVSASGVAPQEAPALEIEVRYGGDDGPDLDEVARRTGLTPAEVVELHCGTTYRAYMLGFAPGFAYLGTVPDGLRVARRATPRQRVPAGSVALAGAQTAVYPLATPGGWQLIGRTDVVLWDPQRDPPALIAAGRTVRFVPVRG